MARLRCLQAKGLSLGSSAQEAQKSASGIPGSSSGSLTLGSSGFSMSTSESLIVWSVNVSVVLNSPILQLLDNGNLILRYESGGDSEGCGIWQSFDNVTDPLLPKLVAGI